jgi:DNA-binding transcriptional regulator YiaG
MGNEGRDYAALVKLLRQRLGLTQEQFAHHLGVTFASVNRWENGQVTPSPLARQRLEALDRETVSPKPVRGKRSL